MRTRPFGPTGKQVPVVGQGTWRMEADDRASCIQALRRGVEAGAVHVDTAEMYGGGEVEKLVGEALSGVRERVFLVSKVLPQNASGRGTAQACERSLGRLGTDRIDLYLLHWPGSHPLADTLAAFERLQREGKIHHFGVSNFDADELEEAVRLAGPGRIACNQVLYHPGERAVEHRVLAACERHGVALVAYSPFDTGSLRTAGVMDDIARQRGATPHQVALAFLIRRPSVFAIPKAATPRHAEENAAAGDLVLTEDEIARIEQDFPRGPDRPGVPIR